MTPNRMFLNVLRDEVFNLSQEGLKMCCMAILFLKIKVVGPVLQYFLLWIFGFNKFIRMGVEGFLSHSRSTYSSA